MRKRRWAPLLGNKGLCQAYCSQTPSTPEHLCPIRARCQVICTQDLPKKHSPYLSAKYPGFPGLILYTDQDNFTFLTSAFSPATKTFAGAVVHVPFSPHLEAFPRDRGTHVTELCFSVLRPSYPALSIHWPSAGVQKLILLPYPANTPTFLLRLHMVCFLVIKVDCSCRCRGPLQFIPLIGLWMVSRCANQWFIGS